jgi:hypothetical protein
MISALISLAALAFILKFRVHVHVTYTPSASPVIPQGHSERMPRPEAARHPRPATRRNATGAPSSKSESTNNLGRVGGDSPILLDIESALIHLGTSRAVARQAAERAVFHQDPDLETALRRAIDYARQAA